MTPAAQTPAGSKPRPIVVKVGGTTIEDPATSPALWDAIATLAARRGGAIVVHGGGKGVDRLLQKLNFTVERRGGLRVTPPDQIDYIVGVLAGSTNKHIAAELLRRGVRAVGICLGDGNAVTTARKIPASPAEDLGLVGEPSPTTHASAQCLLDVLLRSGFTPVLSSIGIDTDGTLLNVNADEGALGAALAARAGTLVLMTDVPGILDESREVIPEVDQAGIEELISRGTVSGGMIPKARSAANAAAALKAPVVILSGNNPASLSDWAAGRPVGTRVVAMAAPPALRSP